MKLLVTSDLHLVRVWRQTVLSQLAQWVRELAPDALLITGDIAVATEADTALEELRRVFTDGPIIVTLGNHDFWGGAIGGCRTLPEVIERFWKAPAQRYGVTLLDQENFYSKDVVLVGGYGHYDLGFAIPQLRYQGQVVTQEHYLSGRPPTETPLRWRDFDWMPRPADVVTLASAQVAAVQARITATDSTRVILALHTPPFDELLGIPDASGLDLENPPIRAFFRAYLGNRSMGEMVRLHAGRINALVCGHTHRIAGPTDLGGFLGVNVGSDYGTPRGLIFDTEGQTATITSIAELTV